MGLIKWLKWAIYKHAEFEDSLIALQGVVQGLTDEEISLIRKVVRANNETATQIIDECIDSVMQGVEFDNTYLGFTVEAYRRIGF